MLTLVAQESICISRSVKFDKMLPRNDLMLDQHWLWKSCFPEGFRLIVIIILQPKRDHVSSVHGVLRNPFDLPHLQV